MTGESRHGSPTTVRFAIQPPFGRLHLASVSASKWPGMMQARRNSTSTITRTIFGY